MSHPLEKMHSTAMAEPKNFINRKKIKVKTLQTWNTENITSEVVKVGPILVLAPPPPEWIAFLEILALGLEVFF